MILKSLKFSRGLRPPPRPSPGRAGGFRSAGKCYPFSAHASTLRQSCASFEGAAPPSSRRAGRGRRPRGLSACSNLYLAVPVFALRIPSFNSLLLYQYGALTPRRATPALRTRDPRHRTPSFPRSSENCALPPRRHAGAQSPNMGPRIKGRRRAGARSRLSASRGAAIDRRSRPSTTVSASPIDRVPPPRPRSTAPSSPLSPLAPLPLYSVRSSPSTWASAASRRVTPAGSSTASSTASSLSESSTGFFPFLKSFAGSRSARRCAP